MPGKFVLKKVKTGYHFVLKASNGETIAQSEVYSSKSGEERHRADPQERGKRNAE